MSQTERFYWIDAEIRSGRFPNAQSLCDQFEVSRRTAYSDRDTLIERLGAPLKFDRMNGGWTYADPTFVLPFLALSEREATALARSFMAAKEYLGSADAAAVAQIAAKLTARLPAVRPSQQESIAGSIHPAADVSVSTELHEACRIAIERRMRLDILYYSAHRDQTLERTVHPYHLHNFQGEWHLLAWCEQRQAVRQFYLGRIRKWRLLPGEGAYQIDPNFDARQYLGKGFGLKHGEEMTEVTVIFSTQQARWTRERIYHPSQRTRELHDGRLELTLTVAGTEEVRRWLLSYGPDVEVIAPPSLRQEIAEAAKKLTEIYG